LKKNEQGRNGKQSNLYIGSIKMEDGQQTIRREKKRLDQRIEQKAHNQ
jgi:hypothetical protein